MAKFLATFAENFQAPAVIVRELRAGVPQIRGTPTSVGALLGRAERGPDNKAIRLDSFAKFQRIFGTYDPNSYAAESVDAFFKNGGSATYFTRIVGSSGGSNVKSTLQLLTVAGAVATSGTDTSDPASFPADIPAGTVFDGTVDGGAVAGFTIQATAAQKDGAGASYAAGAGGDNIVLNINGGPDQTIDLSTALGTQASYLATINSQLVGGQAVDNGGQIRIRTDRKGSSASGTIVSLGGAAAAKTGLSTGAFTNAGPNNVADDLAVTASEFAGLMNTGFPGSTSVANANGSVTWTSNTTGASSSVQFSLPASIAALIPGFDLSAHTGSATTKTNSLDVTAIGYGSYGNGLKASVSREDTKIGLPGSALAANVAVATVTEIELTSAVASRVTVGDQLKFSDSGTSQTIRGVVSQIKNNIVVFAAGAVLGGGGLTVANTTITNETWSLSVLEGGRIIKGPYKDLRMSSLSQKNYFVTRINTDDDENVVTVSDDTPVMQPNNLDVRPENATAGGDALAGGSAATGFADTDYIGSSASQTGLYSLDKKKDVRLVAIPGVTGVTAGAVSKAVVDYCTAREDCVAVIEPPANTTVAAAVTYRNDNIGASSYGLMYYPWVQIVSPLTSQKAVSPPTGYIMGMIARTDRQRGIQKAPAGEFVGRLVGTVGVERILSNDDRAQLYPNNINPIEDIEGVGQCVMGSRALEKGEFEQINIRRTFIYLRTSLQEGTRFVLFEPNDPATRAKVRRSISGFLGTEWKKGTLEGEELGDAFYVTCDETNNPLDVINAGKMIVAVGVNIPKTTEFLVIEIQQDQRGVEASLVA